MPWDGHGNAWLPRTLATEDLAHCRLVHAARAQSDVSIEVELFRYSTSLNPMADGTLGSLQRLRLSDRPRRMRFPPTLRFALGILRRRPRRLSKVSRRLSGFAVVRFRSGHAAFVKRFGRREAYESLRRRNPRGPRRSARGIGRFGSMAKRLAAAGARTRLEPQRSADPEAAGSDRRSRRPACAHHSTDTGRATRAALPQAG